MYNNFFRVGFPEFDTRLMDAVQSKLYKMFEDELGVKGTKHHRSVFPTVNIFDSADTYLLEAELPGSEKEDIDIQVAGSKITISGELKSDSPENMSYHRREREFGKFSRTFTLPEDADTENVKAEYKNGILSIKIGKSEKSQPRKITVNAE